MADQPFTEPKISEDFTLRLYLQQAAESIANALKIRRNEKLSECLDHIEALLAESLGPEKD